MTREHETLEQLCGRVREHEEPSAADRAFVREQLAARLAAVGVGAAAVASAGKAAASGSMAPVLGAPALGTSGTALASAGGALKLSSFAGVAAWLAGGASVTAATLLLAHSLATVPEGAAPIAPPRAQVLPPGQITPARARPVVPAPVAPAPVAPTSVAPRRPRSEPAASKLTAPVKAASAASVKPSLAAEAQGLARVQRALRDGDTSAALALLDEQDRRFRGGSLAAERTAARALASCDSGRSGQLLAERFAQDHAGSPLAERVQRKCLNRP